MADLITSAYAIQQIGGSLPTGYSSVLPDAITTASELVQRFCQRDFVITTYDDSYSSLGFSAFLTRQYPVTVVSRVATGLQTVITISNTDATTNQRATAALTNTVDTATNVITATGITLVRVASGVTTTDTSTVFATYPTLQSVADHINGLGGGWNASVLTGYTLWPSSDLKPIQGAQGALAGVNGEGAQLQAFTNDVNGWNCDYPTGRIQLNAQQWDPVFALMNLGSSPLQATFPPGFDNVRVVYTAGYVTIPFAVQQATLITVQDLVWKMMRPQFFKSENAKDYSYTLNEVKQGGLPKEASDLLLAGGWKSYRRY